MPTPREERRKEGERHIRHRTVCARTHKASRKEEREQSNNALFALFAATFSSSPSLSPNMHDDQSLHIGLGNWAMHLTGAISKAEGQAS